MATVNQETEHSGPELDALEDPTVVRRRRYTADEFRKLYEIGVLGDSERVELIDGDVLVMSPIGSRHVGVVVRLDARLQAMLAGRALVFVQAPVRLSDRNEPLPDVALVKLRDDFYTSGLPTPTDIFTVVEVMESSTSYDCKIKLKLYARSGVPEVWLVDLKTDGVEVYRRPEGEGYAEARTAARGDSVAPAAFPDAAVGVDDLLGLGGPR